MSTTLDKLLVARCMYSYGVPYMSDAEYDQLVACARTEGIELNPIYEDDPIPYESFSRILGVEPADVDKMLATGMDVDQNETSVFADGDTALDFLSESESLSITSVNTFEEAFNWFTLHKNVEVVLSTKIDGINTRRGYHAENGKLTYLGALTRGRHINANPFNVSDNMKKISPSNVTTHLEGDLVVYSETVAYSNAIQIINEKYDRNYKIPRGLAMAMMRVSTFDNEDYKYLKSFVFRMDWGDKQSHGLELAATLGFDVVPYTLYTYKGETYAEFKEQMSDYIDKLKSLADSMDVVTDGLVAEVNDRSYYGQADVHNGYSSANLALKIGKWEPGVYESEVVSLDLTQQSDRCTCVAVVKPVVATNGQTLSRVNCFNPSVLFDNSILPGSKIRFEYKNETTINIILGEPR